MRSAMVLVAIVAVGCTPTPSGPAWQLTQPRIVDTACDWVMPMTFSADDTAATKAQILAYEVARRRNCAGSSVGAAGR